MRTCSICREEVTQRMIREGGALSRGASYFHRECHRESRGAPPLAAPIPRAAGEAFEATSFPEIELGVELAGFWRRFGAHVVDGVILNVFVFFASLLIGMAMGIGGAEASAAGVVGALFGAILPLIYCIWFWVKKGATPGKMVLGIRVVGHDGGPPTGVQSFIRYIGYIPSALVFCLGYFWMIFDSENRCWHDMMAGTRVVRI